MSAASKCAAAALEQMVNQPVCIKLENMCLVGSREIESYLWVEIGEIGTVVGMKFTGSSSGTALLLLPAAHDDLLLRAFLQDEEDEAALIELKGSVLVEAGNIILNACVGTITNRFGSQVQYQVPQLIFSPTPDQLFRLTDVKDEQHWLLLTSRMSIGALNITAYILVMMDYPNEQIEKLFFS
jgi:chemotaxis protein CheC